MLRILVISALIAAASAAGVSLRKSPFGIVEGITDCGSSGRLGEVQVTDCTLTPCKFIPNNVYDVSVRFTASRTSSNLALYIYRGEDDTPFVELPIDGEIEVDIEYELRFQLPVSTDFSGTAFDVRVYILDFTNLRVEVCAKMGVEIA